MNMHAEKYFGLTAEVKVCEIHRPVRHFRNEWFTGADGCRLLSRLQA
jgi:hypothetical protein